MELETLLVDRSDGVATVTLNRPEKKNAINGQMWVDLQEVLPQLARDKQVRVIVMTGAGGAFCSGADLTGGRAGDDDRGQLDRMREVADVAMALHRIPKPTIAKVGGVAAGAGCAMALACDLVVASDEARFSLIFARRGLSLDFGSSYLLPRLVGLHKAKEMAFFADILSAKEAQELGIVNRLVPANDLDRFVDDWASRLAAGPPIALSMTKALLNQSLMVGMDQALEAEGQAQTVNFGSEDTREAMAAFVEKRDPRFTGR